MYAPYVNYYTKILNKKLIKYSIINWNKLDIEEHISDGYTYNFKNDHTSKLFNKLLGYYMFARFVKRILRKEKFDKLIIFVPQLAIFLKDYLIRNYEKKYILDIRDYGKSNLYIKKLEKVIEYSSFTAISSQGYKDWLPSKFNYVISHNTAFSDKKALNRHEILDINEKNEIIISNIGIIRNYYENLKFINAIKNSRNYKLMFFGKGVCEEDLKEYCKSNDILNVSFHGIYQKDQELSFYEKSDLIYLIVPQNNIGNNSAMANRFYNSCIAGRPMIVNKGSYMDKVVREYGLGIAIDIEKKDFIKDINEYIANFDYASFIKGCDEFLDQVIEEQLIFEQRVSEFLHKE